LVVVDPGNKGDGMLLRSDDGKPLVWSLSSNGFEPWENVDCKPALFGEYTAPDGRTVKTVMTLIAEKYLDEQYAPENAAKITGVSAEDIERMALEMAHVAFKETIEIPTPWTDGAGREHKSFIGRPVAMHAMRGISAHSNGFHTCRAIHLVQVLLGAVDSPGSHLAKPPFPRHVPPPIKPAKEMAPNTPLKSPPLGFPVAPEDLVIDDDGNPLRIDKAYSWEAPISSHGLMHMVINNAAKGDPYEIDTLILFMANMAWNSSMNTKETQDMLRAKREDGEYKIPFIVTSDAFHSEMVSFSDLVLPDTTYLERYDTISMLDRPISEPHVAADSIRQPIVEADRDVRPWQEVMIELGTRLKFPALTKEDGSAKYQGYKDFIVNWEKAPGLGFLGGYRGKDGSQSMTGEPNPNQWEAYIENGCFFEHHLPPEQRYYRFANKAYLEWAKEVHFNAHAGPVVMELYSETLQKFNLAGQGLYDGPLPKTAEDKERLTKYFDPLPIFYTPLEEQRIKTSEYPFHAVNQRPMFMYHSWDSQNAWLRQIMAQNFLYMNRKRGEELGIEDLGWAWVESHNGKIRVQVKLMEGCNPDTVWTWNAIGKQKGAWGLSKDAPESNRGFLMNHLISELLPAQNGQRELTNSDPVTGQAAWYDLRVKITPTSETGSWPEFDVLPTPPGVSDSPEIMYYSADENVNLKRSLKDTLFRGEK
ncbi:MAG: molybdopterin oxidoreductase family protein, partial [Gammaproteobacteria bacterium]|nr:molybdopterin oxidoreductase family protein [Gammaproteobacteria bacterium]